MVSFAEKQLLDRLFQAFTTDGSGNIALRIIMAAGAAFTMAEGADITLGTVTGTKIGTATTQKLGFFNATPIVQPSAYTQTYSTADKTHAAMTSADLVTTAVTQTTPWGFASQAQGDAIATQVNALRADVIDVKQLVNSLIDDLQALGLVG